MLIYELRELEFLFQERAAELQREAKNARRVRLVHLSQRASKYGQAARIFAPIIALALVIVQKPMR